MTEFWAGIAGTIVGTCATLLGQWLKHCWETRNQRERDKERKKMLTEMLDAAGSDGWRKMNTLSRVIGASREETARLLIEIGARGNQKGKDVWAWKRHHPLPKSD